VVNIQVDVFEATGEAPLLPFFHLNQRNFHGTDKLKAIALNMLGIKNLCALLTLKHKLWKGR
jgi:hypothetical protein